MSKLAYITHRIYNEPFSNSLLVAGLTIACTIIWFIMDTFFVTWKTFHEPMGLDISHCYNLQLADIPEESPAYDHHHPKSQRQTAADIANILKQLAGRKEVEAVCISINASPYTNQNANTNFSYKGQSTDSTSVILRSVSPDYVEVFRYADIKSGDYRPLRDALQRNEILLSESLEKYFHRQASSMPGQYVNPWHMKIGGVFKTVKYDEYSEQSYSYQVVTLLADSTYDTWNALSVRVKPSCEKAFVTALHKTDYRTGNIYIKNITSYETLRRNYLDSYQEYFNQYRVGFVFILVNVFLGLYGTFSYRTWQRREETGLQKVLGATSATIALRLFWEALLLLGIATGLSTIIALNLTHLKINQTYEGHHLECGRFILSMLATYAVMAVTILSGILHPVLKASIIKPINTLKHE